MAKKQCIKCKKELGMMAVKMVISQFEASKIPIPSDMTKDDVMCADCFMEIEKEQKAASAIAASSDPKSIASFNQLNSRVPEFKERWDKNGVIEYKDDYCAILQRSFGRVVEFIIAYSDLTKQGYRLMAQDEGASVGSSGISGGGKSYYYFQKIEYVSNKLSE